MAHHSQHGQGQGCDTTLPLDEASQLRISASRGLEGREVGFCRGLPDGLEVRDVVVSLGLNKSPFTKTCVGLECEDVALQTRDPCMCGSECLVESAPPEYFCIKTGVVGGGGSVEKGGESGTRIEGHVAVPRWQCCDGGGEVRGRLSKDLEDPVVFIEGLPTISPQDLAVRAFLDPVYGAEVGGGDVNVEHGVLIIVLGEALGGLDMVGVLCFFETSLEVPDLLLTCDVGGHLRLSALL